MEEPLRKREIDHKFMEELIKENPSYDKLTELLEDGADINSVYYIFQPNCIMQLIGLGHVNFKNDFNKAKKIIDFMIDNGADMYHLDDFGWSIIHNCADLGNKEILKYFLDKGVSPNYIWLWRGTPIDILEHPVLDDKELLSSIKEILKSYGGKTSLELRTNKIKKYLKVDLTSDIDLCFMSESGYLNVSDIPGADENELSELVSIYQSFCNKEIIDLKSEEPDKINEFNDRGLKLVKSIIPKLASKVYLNFHQIDIQHSGKWLRKGMFVKPNTEFGLFEYQIPDTEEDMPF